jgi:putative membrane protein
MDGWDWFWGALMMLLFWGGLAAVIVLAVRAASARGPRPRSGETTDARTILENRFARGEISAEEFEQRKGVLESSVR